MDVQQQQQNQKIERHSKNQKIERHSDFAFPLGKKKESEGFLFFAREYYVTYLVSSKSSPAILS